MFCAPTATLLPLAAAITVGSSTGEGNRAISSRVCPATSGKKASTNALASAGVLYIFQLAAIIALRGIFLRLLESIVVDYLRREGDDGHNTGQRFLFRTRPYFSFISKASGSSSLRSEEHTSELQSLRH